MGDAAVVELDPGREADERAARVLLLAAHGWGLGDIATDTELEPVEVIDILHAHRDCFVPEFTN